MRRLFVLGMLLLLLPIVNAQAICGDGEGEGSEECDDGNLIDGDGCSSLCLLEKDSSFVLWDLAIGHNLLFSKVMDLLHIIKHSLFQLELKMIEMQLTNNPCDQQPVSFWMPADVNPYGKLNEIDAMIELLIQSIRDGGVSNFGLTGEDVDDAESLLDEADECIGESQFRQAFECKCLAYRNELLGGEDSSVSCNDPCGGD